MFGIFLCRERAGAESIIQMLNKWLFYRVVLQNVTTAQTGGLSWPRMAKSSLNCHENHNQSKASFMASCRAHSPFIPSVPLFFTLSSPGNNTASTARLRVETSRRIPAPPQMQARLNPRASSGEKRSKSKHTQDHPEWEDGDHHKGESCMATFIVSILSTL